MTHLRDVFPRRTPLGLGLVLILAMPWTSFAQPKAEPKIDPLNLRVPKPDVAAHLDSMRKAALPLNQAELEEMAIWLVYRFEQPEYRNPDLTPKNGGFARLLDDASRQMIIPGKPPFLKLREEQVAYIKAFGDKIEKHLRVVLRSNQPIVVLNVCMLMQLLASTGYPDMDRLIVDIFTQPSKVFADSRMYEIGYLYAAKACQDWLRVPHPDDPRRHVLRDPVRLSIVASTLEKFITRDPGTLDPAAVAYVRREAVRALAAMKFGVIRDENGDKALARPAWTLWSIAMIYPPDKYKPNITLMEELEAIIGFCSMTIDEDMNLDLAAWGVCNVLEYVLRSLGDPKQQAQIPWKITATRMIQAVNVWKTNLAKVDKARESDRAIELANLILSDDLFGGWEKPSDSPHKPDRTPLLEWAQKYPPRKNMLFEKAPETTYAPRQN